ncbi:MAG TPA: hypothetical protein VII40_13060 [Xanthobacteraceae bacterium]
MFQRKPAPDLIRGGRRFAVKDMRHSMSEARCAAERECAMVRVPRFTGRGRRVVGRQLRNAVLIGTSVMAIGALSCTGAAALSFENINGKWCTQGGSEQFDKENLVAIVAATGDRRIYPIVSYDYQSDMIRVTWKNEKGENVHTDFSEFSRNGRRMVQVPNEVGPRREFYRC